MGLLVDAVCDALYLVGLQVFFDLFFGGFVGNVEGLGDFEVGFSVEFLG